MDLTQQEFRKIISIGIELTTETDRNKLLDKYDSCGKYVYDLRKYGRYQLRCGNIICFRG